MMQIELAVSVPFDRYGVAILVHVAFYAKLEALTSVFVEAQMVEPPFPYCHPSFRQLLPYEALTQSYRPSFPTRLATPLFWTLYVCKNPISLLLPERQI